MPIRDTAAMNASLNNDYGATKGPNAPASHELALFDGDPMIDALDGGGVEVAALDCPGYARVTLANDAGWLAAADGMKKRAALAQFPATTGEWLTPVTHWALIASGGVVWDCGPLTEPLEVTGAGDGPEVAVTVFYDDSVAIPE